MRSAIANARRLKLGSTSSTACQQRRVVLRKVVTPRRLLVPWRQRFPVPLTLGLVSGGSRSVLISRYTTGYVFLVIGPWETWNRPIWALLWRMERAEDATVM